MDRIWNSYKLNNRLPLSDQVIGEFYNHPIWLLNGIFTQLDSTSVQHRQAIAQYVQKLNVKHLADYGGGFGELALAVTHCCSNTEVSIVEPYPSLAGQERVKHEARIKFTTQLVGDKFDVITAQDVLEHVEDPIELACKIAGAVREGGTVVFANCFYPVILCHLPTTFHLRHSFIWIMRAMGLRYIGIVDGASHAQIFIREGTLNLDLARRAEFFSRFLGPVYNVAYKFLSAVKHRLIRS